MKVRTDFVTNSSSSSFILAFTDEESIKYELLSGFPDELMDEYRIVYCDIMDADRLTKEQVIERIRNEYRWKAINETYPGEKHSMEMYSWAETEEGKRAINEYIDGILKEVSFKFDTNSVFVEIEYDDYGYGRLEQDILPNVQATVISFSHH